MRIQSVTRAAALAAACTVASAAFAQAPKPQPPSPATKTAPMSSQASSDDSAFAKQAAEAGMAEMEHGRMAARKSSNAQVKAYGNRLVKDHAIANNQLKAIAKRHNIELPASAPAGDQTWTTETGAAFDKGFVDAQVKAHEDAVALFEKESQNGSDKEIKAFAARQLPGLRAHLKQAQDLQKKLSASTH